MSIPPFHDHALITGGAGFIGTNLAERLLSEGRSVVVLDDFSRPGVERNARHLAEVAPGRVAIVRDDCRNVERVRELVRGAAEIYHFAAQVAVTTSLGDPVSDFDINLRGTLNVLEAVRRLDRRPPLVFTSTNKVYGPLSDLALRVVERRYAPEEPIAGIDEARPLDFHSPYGCSKGAADQYVLDYARTYGLRNVVFRMSCIYGPHQCGNEDQGWVAHFLMRALAGQPITIYGNGYQVRDVLYATDLVDALLAARARVDEISGQAFNVGGGDGNALSLLELLERIESLTGRRVDVRFAAPRNGDQRYFVTDTTKIRRALGWSPAVAVDEGIRRLHAWFSRAAGKEREQPSTPKLRAQVPRAS